MKYCNARKETFDEITVFGKPALFTYKRIDEATVPSGLYKYDVRLDEYNGEIAEIAEKYNNDHFGSIITAEKINLNRFGRRSLTRKEDWCDKPYNGKDECVGSIEYYNSDGSVRGVFDYDDEIIFREDVEAELREGVRIALIIYTRTSKRRKISLHWLPKEHPLLKEIRVRRFPKEPCNTVLEFGRRYATANSRQF